MATTSQVLWLTRLGRVLTGGGLAFGVSQMESLYDDRVNLLKGVRDGDVMSTIFMRLMVKYGMFLVLLAVSLLASRLTSSPLRAQILRTGISRTAFSHAFSPTS